MQDLDLSLIKNGGMYGVHCPTEEEAIAFVSFMKTEYPERTKFWCAGELNWDAYCEETVYYPHFEIADGQMLYGKIGGLSAARSTIVSFSELVKVQELPIECSDIPISALFET